MNLVIPESLKKIDPKRSKPHIQRYQEDSRWLECNGLPYDYQTGQIRGDLIESMPEYQEALKDFSGVPEEALAAAVANETKLDPTKCQAIKPNGKQCGMDRPEGQDYCHLHRPKAQAVQPEAGE